MCLFKPACLSYIKPQKEQKGYFVSKSVFFLDSLIAGQSLRGATIP